MEKVDISSLPLPQLTEWVTGTLGEPKFRAGQIYRWIHQKRVGSFAEMTNLSTALRQKLDGMNRREKFRLRYYGKEPAFFKLEKKYKVKGLCAKGSCRLSREEGERLLRRDFAFLLEKEEPLAREFYAKLRRGLAPKTVVRYTREAFLYAPGNVRVTLDGDIRAGAPERFLIPQKLLPALGGLAVVEVKYDAFLPEIVKLAAQVPNRQGTACSKYALCRRYD